ncbi:MAG: hypothetical protein AVDCRST_MAG57-3107, partial [uncultured Blastococcus sp.]
AATDEVRPAAAPGGHPAGGPGRDGGVGGRARGPAHPGRPGGPDVDVDLRRRPRPGCHGHLDHEAAGPAAPAAIRGRPGARL